MNPRDAARNWAENVSDPELKCQLEELISHGSDAEVEDAFFQDISFGTAGLRGVVGPGTNRMNVYTVGRATQGLADYLNQGAQRDSVPSVAIARDSRHKGDLFVRRAASVLAGNGIRSYIYPRIEPTPALSFAVRDLGCDAGINMTASHNPAEYNGYKAYGSDGCQITSEMARWISARIESIDPFTQVKSMPFEEAEKAGLVEWIADDTLDRFVSAVLENSLPDESADPSKLKIAYTPLCGTGLECLQQIFESIGLEDVALVESQIVPDGSFPTCPVPNPEERAALEEGIATARENDADLLLATDPDADRVGIAVRHCGDYVLLTGNEVGILLFDYICRMRAEKGTMPKDPIAVTTIVSTAMVDGIADAYGVEMRRTLTGFKYIGDIITELEHGGEEDRFLFGFEESYGYLAGSHVRDKDAAVAAMLICQMAMHYAAHGKDLVQALGELYETYGHHANRTVNIAFPGAEGAANMRTLMEELRAGLLVAPANAKVLEIVDYANGVGGLPASNVVEYRLDNGCKLIFRPSGTEPKIKIYLFAKSDSSSRCHALIEEMERVSRAFMQPR